jgi:hypothetical protein
VFGVPGKLVKYVVHLSKFFPSYKLPKLQSTSFWYQGILGIILLQFLLSSLTFLHFFLFQIAVLSTHSSFLCNSFTPLYTLLYFFFHSPSFFISLIYSHFLIHSPSLHPICSLFPIPSCMLTLPNSLIYAHFPSLSLTFLVKHSLFTLSYFLHQSFSDAKI